MRTLPLLAIVGVSACLPPASPVQQGQDAERELACVVKDWGKPIEVVAHDCTKDSIQLAIDLIADGAVLLGLERQPNPYVADPRVQASMRARFSDGGPAASAPVTGTGSAGQPAK